MSSQDSESDGPGESHPGDYERLNSLVGRTAHTHLRPGSCIGDDMTSKGLDTTRFGALQANGAGGSPSAFVTGWCKTIQLLLVDVFCISETRIAPEWKHIIIENLFLEKGFAVISHNRPSGNSPTDPHTNS